MRQRRHSRWTNANKSPKIPWIRYLPSRYYGEDTLDQLIEQALRELDRVEPDGLAEERMSDISDEIRRDLRLEETQRTLMLDYITQLNRVAQKQRRCLYIQGAKDCVQLLRSLGVIK